jgi:hypothetical protein
MDSEETFCRLAPPTGSLKKRNFNLLIPFKALVIIIHHYYYYANIFSDAVLSDAEE